ncbi:MAG: hypothetical protein WCL39_10130, partial [Armatimonadota bacterium]
MTKTQITYPVGAIKTLVPPVAFIAEPHDGFQVQVIEAGRIVWDSGEVNSHEYSLRSHSLPSESQLFSRVRIRTGDVWQDWTEGSAFTTPQSPVVRIIKPSHAGRAIGPCLELSFEIESDKPLESLSVSVDDDALEPELRTGVQSLNTRLDGGIHSVVVRA